MIPVWQGSANTWDCDDMGHMNVRVYVEKAMEGLGVLAVKIGMEHAFKAGSPSTLLPSAQHIRYIREIYVGRPASMTACVLEVGESDAVIYQDMRHPDGRCAAAFRTRILHINAKTGAPFPWSKRSRTALEELIDTPPEDAKPRSLNLDGAYLPDTEATLATVEKANAPLIGLGTVPPQHCDVFGRMETPWFIGRVSDSVPNLLYDWRQSVAMNSNKPQTGGAVLEYRLIYRKWPRAGDILQLHSSFAGTTEKTHSLVHWALDPATGDAWMTSQVIAVTFDLEARKVIPTTSEDIAELERLAPKGLTI